jgi:hypothetical protein
MITSAFLNLVYFFVISVTAVLPEVTSLPDNFNDAVDFIFTEIAKWNAVIDIFSTMFTVLILVLTIEGVILTFAGANWVINKVRGSG